jgi:hypothetical protein
MQNSAKAIAVAASFIMTALIGCGGPAGSGGGGPEAVGRFTSKSAPIEFTFPGDWQKNVEKHPYDLQCVSRSETMNTGVFAFKKEDVAEDLTPLDVFWLQVEDMQSKRKNFEEIEALEHWQDDDRLITTVTYAGEKDGSQFYYRFSLIRFPEDDSTFAVAIQVALPDEWSTSKPILAEITQSAKSKAQSG